MSHSSTNVTKNYILVTFDRETLDLLLAKATEVDKWPALKTQEDANDPQPTPQITVEPILQVVAPVTKKRGRPPGARNKPKPAHELFGITSPLTAPIEVEEEQIDTRKKKRVKNAHLDVLVEID